MTRRPCINDPSHKPAIAQGRCASCYESAYRRGELVTRPRRRTADVLEDFAILRARGLDREQIAAKLGYRGRAGIDKALSRARRRGMAVTT